MAIAYARPRFGESFYEELRVGAKTAETEHPLMQRSEEPFLSQSEILIEHKVLEAAMRMRDIESIQSVLMGMVEGHKAKTQASQLEESLHDVWAPPSRTLH